MENKKTKFQTVWSKLKPPSIDQIFAEYESKHTNTLVKERAKLKSNEDSWKSNTDLGKWVYGLVATSVGFILGSGLRGPQALVASATNAYFSSENTLISASTAKISSSQPSVKVLAQWNDQWAMVMKSVDKQYLGMVMTLVEYAALFLGAYILVSFVFDHIRRRKTRRIYVIDEILSRRGCAFG